jgi:hypothetical protein
MHTVQCGISLVPNIAGMSKLRALARLAREVVEKEQT